MRGKIAISVLVLAIILVVALGVYPPGKIDTAIFRFINRSLENPVFNLIMPVVTDFEKWRAVVLLIWAGLILFGGNKGRWAGLFLIPLIVASDQISSHLLKPLIARTRPCDMLGNVHLWYGHEGWIITPSQVVQSYKSSFSFPSSHAANITASMLFLALVYRRIAIPLILFAFLVSLSRIYIGVHWPADVLAGMTLGAILAIIAYFLFKKLTQQAQGRESSE